MNTEPAYVFPGGVSAPTAKRTISLTESGMARDLYEVQYPGSLGDQERWETYRNELEEQGFSYGVWVFYPDEDTLVQLPPKDDFWDLLNSRLRGFYGQDQLLKLRKEVSIAVFGLSTGSNIIDDLVRSGIGDRIIFGDFDKLSITNIGRTALGATDIGELKTSAISRMIRKVNPFVERAPCNEGYRTDMEDQLLAQSPSVVFDQMDDMLASARLRDFCHRNNILYLSVADVDDRAVVEVVRHDRGKSPLYASRIARRLGAKAVAGDELSEFQHSLLFALSVGVNNLTPRLIEAANGVGKNLPGLPQDPITAKIGAALSVDTFRRILLGEDVKTGLYNQKITNIPPARRLRARSYVGAIRSFL